MGAMKMLNPILGEVMGALATDRTYRKLYGTCAVKTVAIDRHGSRLHVMPVCNQIHITNGDDIVQIAANDEGGAVVISRFELAKVSPAALATIDDMLAAIDAAAIALGFAID